MEVKHSFFLVLNINWIFQQTNKNCKPARVTAHNQRHPKFLKVTAYFLLNLNPNLKISRHSGKKLQKYCEKNGSLEYLSKMSYLLPKNLLRESGNPEILHTIKKKTLK